jgi:hypothetical protein
LIPKYRRMRLNPMMAAPTDRAKTAVLGERDRGELAIDVLERGLAPGRGTTTGD